MLELLSLVGGAAARLAPAVLDLFKRWQDNKQELAMLDRQLALGEQQARAKQAEIAATSEARLAEIRASGAIDIDKASVVAMADALKEQMQPTGVRWVDALNSSVRPIVTYWWTLVLYTAYKTTLILDAVASKVTGRTLADILVTDFDKAVIGSILGFWFTDRALRTLNKP